MICKYAYKLLITANQFKKWFATYRIELRITFRILFPAPLDNTSKCFNTYPNTNLYNYLFMCVCAKVWLRIWVCAWLWVCMGECVSVRLCVCTFMRVWMCVNVCACVCACVWVCVWVRARARAFVCKGECLSCTIR